MTDSFETSLSGPERVETFKIKMKSRVGLIEKAELTHAAIPKVDGYVQDLILERSKGDEVAIVTVVA